MKWDINKKTTAILIMITLIGIIFSGCGKTEHVVISEEAHTIYAEPAVKADDSPYVLGIIDENPPIESSYLWLKGLCERLQELGYISHDVDLSAAPADYESYFEYITKQDLGGKLIIDKSSYLLNEENREMIGSELRQKVADGKLDLIAATGTYPGTFLKELELPIPFLVSFASDPVYSGIIESTEKTGDENVWALVEPMAFSRQLEIYKNITGFEKLGIITTDEYDEAAGGPEIDKKAAELGVEVVKEILCLQDMYTERAQGLYTDSVKKLADQDVDAVLVLFGVLDGSQASPESAIPILAEKKIPYLISDGEDLVRNGGMLLISFYNYEGYGNHVADICSNIFHGEKAEEQTIEYISSPKVVLNMDTARELGFETDFEFLQTVDKIYRREAE